MVLCLELIELGGQACQSALQSVQTTVHAGLRHRSAREHKDCQYGDAKEDGRHQLLELRFSIRSIYHSGSPRRVFLAKPEHQLLVGDEAGGEAQRRCRIGPPVHGVVIADAQRPQGRGPAGHLTLDRARADDAGGGRPRPGQGVHRLLVLAIGQVIRREGKAYRPQDAEGRQGRGIPADELEIVEPTQQQGREEGDGARHEWREGIALRQKSARAVSVMGSWLGLGVDVVVHQSPSATSPHPNDAFSRVE